MKNDWIKAFANISQIGINMFVTIMLCFFIGKWLDSKLGTNVLFLIIFTFLGVASAFRNLYVLVIKQYDIQEKNNQKLKNEKIQNNLTKQEKKNENK